MQTTLRVMTVFLLWCLTAGWAVAQDQDGTVTVNETAKARTIIVIDGDGTISVQSEGPAEAATDDSREPDTNGDPVGMPMGTTSLMNAQDEAVQFRETLRKRLQAMPASINEVLYVLRASSPSGEIRTFVDVFFWSLVLFGIGMLVERFVYGPRIAAHFVKPRIKKSPEGYLEKLPFLLLRFVGGVIGVLVSMAVAYLLGALLFPPIDDTAIRFTVVIINTAYFGSRVAALFWRMVLSPYLSQYRIPKFSDHDARKLHHWLWILAMLDLSTLMFTSWLGELGLNYDVYALMYGALTIIASAGHTTMILVNRKAVARAIRNGAETWEVSWLQRVVSVVWAPVGIAYIWFSCVELLFDLVLERPTSLPFLLAAYSVLGSILLVYALMSYLIERYFTRSRTLQEVNAEAEMRARAEAAAAMVAPAAEANGTDEAGAVVAMPAELDTEALEQSDADALEAYTETDLAPKEHPLKTFEDLARRAAGFWALVAGTVALARIWGVNTLMTVEEPFYRSLLDILVILFIGYVVFHAFRIWIDRRIEEEQGDQLEEVELGDEGGASAASRLATLLPLFRNVILAVIFVAVALILLMQLGINVSPLFAGAGVVGLAIGFGAQSLVRDIFSGVFFLLDDAFRKGEYIDLGEVKGTVERISVRSFQLRHHLGPLHTIPFGEIQHLTNYSRDWVMMKLPLRVTYDTDVEKVRKLVKKLGISLLDDPEIGESFLQPLKSQGVIEMQDSAMIIRVKFMTKPGDQWVIRKRVFQEIRDLFEREGIKFAHREVTVRLADEKVDNLTPKQKEAVTGAVQAAIDEDAMEDGPGAGLGDDR